MVCRGCGGNGIGQHVPARRVQMLELKYAAEPPAHRMKRVLIVGTVTLPVREQGTYVYRMPLAPLLHTVDELRGKGFDVSGCPWRPEDACDRCHGTGEPALSTATLASLMRSEARK